MARGCSVYNVNVGICDMNGTGFASPVDEREANARLIAAAPDMLQSLEKLEEALKKDSRGKTVNGDDMEYHLSGTDMYCVLNFVRAAIAKAKGTK